MPIRTTIRGRDYTVRQARPRELASDTLGHCARPDSKDPLIVLKPGLRGRQRLVVLIHEALHAALWDLDEEAVDETAGAITRLLWADGYRRVARRTDRG